MATRKLDDDKGPVRRRPTSTSALTHQTAASAGARVPATPERSGSSIALAAAALLMSAVSASAQLPGSTTTAVTTASTTTSAATSAASPKARLIEWNLPAQGDSTPGAVVVDTQ